MRDAFKDRVTAPGCSDRKGDGSMPDDDYDDYCGHVCDEECEDEQGYGRCRHQHCFACGECGCPGYCDDYQTYNLRPAETGGASGA